MRFRRPTVCLTAAIIWLLSVPLSLKAATIELPLFLQTRILQNALEQSLDIQPDGKAVLYQSDAYNYLHISQPVLSTVGGTASFTCKAAAGAGFEPIGILPAGVQWSGFMDLQLLFYVDREWQLRFHVIDSAIYEEDGSKALVSGFIWHLAKKYLHPALEDFSFDLAVPRQEIIALLRICASPEDTRTMEKVLDSVQAGSLQVEPGGVRVPLLLTVPEGLSSGQTPPEPQRPLSEEELEAFRQVFEPLDAFLVFVVKTIGADFVDVRQREKLFELLISSRYQLLSILAGEVAVDTRDPLRLLFTDAWQQLKLIVEESDGQSGLMQEKLLRYMTFINAGDALLVLDAAAPQLGMHISTDGLRRLARMLNPDSAEDPLRFDWQVDPQLRNLFDFIPDDRDEEESQPGSHLLGLFIGTAHAGQTGPGISPEQARRLDRWVPAPDELEDFTMLVARLLEAQASEQIKRTGLGGPFAEIYRHLVPATALMESCWRQYVVKGGRIVFLLSGSGSIGIMQINQHVWRGFFDIDRLKWNTAYNIQTGSRILIHYFKDYGMKVAEKNGKPEDAARSAYSAYNAGPRAARRFMKKNAAAREKQVDSRLWKYFQAISAGGSINLATCSVEQKGL